MKPNIPNQKKNYQALNKRLGGYMAQVIGIYDSICGKIANIINTTDYDGSMEFSFSDYPEMTNFVDELMSSYVSQMNNLIYSGTSNEWKESNAMQDLLARRVLKAYDFEKGGDKYNRYFQPNSAALESFQKRTEKGMDLSAKLWNQSVELKKELECTISTAIDKGQSAVVLSKRLSQYLNDFPSMKADYTEKFGHAINCRDCQYASIRLARTEINMAYRTAEYDRWQQFDFILGYEVKLSKSHPAPDICDDLQGKYPKDFKFVGWHPNCMCYVVPIVMSDDEYYGGVGKSDNEFHPLPDGLGKWVDKNWDKILVANKKGHLAYWLQDNPKVKKCAILIGKANEIGTQFQTIGEKISTAVGGIVTPVNYKTFSSMYRKILTEGIDVSEIKDSVRSTIIVEREDIPKVILMLKNEKGFLRYKEQKAEKFNGYSGHIVNLSMPNGTIAEIQVNTAKMIYAKETEENAKKILGEKLWFSIKKETGIQGGLGHKYYEEIRLLNKETELEKFETLVRASVKYYNKFR